MAKLSPHLRFDGGKCREAMEFYKGIFGGAVKFMTLGESPMAKDSPADKHGLIMHSSLDGGMVSFSGSDMMRDKVVIGDNVVMALDCASKEEIDSLFDKLSKGGEVFMKPEEAFWGAIFGMTTDKYGVEWMLNFQKAPMKG